MNEPLCHGTLSVARDVTSITSTIPVPGLGVLAANAFLVAADEPVLVDTGVPALAEETVAALGRHLDPGDLRWIWLTHCDPDHIGAVDKLLELAPRARIVTNYLGMGKLSMRAALSPERFYLINPGQSLNVGDRELRAVSLPSYDAPETMGVFDPKSAALFSSDCFGALFSEDDARRGLEDVSAVDDASLGSGLVTWTAVDAPWLAQVDSAMFRASLEALRRLAPEVVLGAHLPPARGLLGRLSRHLDAARSATPFVGPDQAALEALLGSAA